MTYFLFSTLLVPYYDNWQNSDISQNEKKNHINLKSICSQISARAKKKFNSNRMAWQWAETLVEIRGTLADIRGTAK